MSGFTLADYAAMLDGPAVEWLTEGWGLADATWMGEAAVRLPYQSINPAETRPVAVRWRIALEGDRFRWNRGSQASGLLYGAHVLSGRRPVVWVVEGETDTLTAWWAGIPTVGVPGTGAWNPDSPHVAELAHRAERVAVLVEDQAGENLAHAVAASPALDGRVDIVASPDHLDLTDLRREHGWGPLRELLERWRVSPDIEQRRVRKWVWQEVKARHHDSETVHTRSGRTIGNPARYTEAALQRAVAEVQAAPEGVRYMTLRDQSYRASRLVHDGLLDEHTYQEAFTAAADQIGLFDRDHRNQTRAAITGALRR